MSKMMRISESIEEQLEGLMEQTGQSRQKVLEIALKDLAKKLFFQKSDEQYRALKQNKAEWGDYLDELKEWDGTLKDGLEDE